MENVMAKDRLFELANCIRALAIDAVEAANSGHPGAPMGMADAAAVLFAKLLKFDAADRDWADRDRFELSNGHGSMLLYSLLHLTGYPGMTIEELKNFQQWGSTTAGHPTYGHAAGIETATGPLGQGIAGAVGMAISERVMESEFGADVVDHRDAPRVAVEAAGKFGWTRYVDSEDDVIGFGASAPAELLYERFGITAEAAAARAEALVGTPVTA